MNQLTIDTSNFASRNAPADVAHDVEAASFFDVLSLHLGETSTEEGASLSFGEAESVPDVTAFESENGNAPVNSLDNSDEQALLEEGASDPEPKEIVSHPVEGLELALVTTLEHQRSLHEEVTEFGPESSSTARLDATMTSHLSQLSLTSQTLEGSPSVLLEQPVAARVMSSPSLHLAGSIERGLQEVVSVTSDMVLPENVTTAHDPNTQLRDLMSHDSGQALPRAHKEPASYLRDQSLWSLWSDRHIEQGAPPAPQVISQSAGQESQSGGAVPGIMASMASDGEGGAAGKGGSGHGGERDLSAVRGTLLPDGSEKFESTLGSVDVNHGPADEKATPTVAQPRARAVLSAVREMIVTRGAGSDAAGATQARIEVRVEGEMLIVNVRIKDGVVDVDVLGLNPVELAKAREELGARLAQSGLSLGDMTEGKEEPDHLEQEDQEQTLALEEQQPAPEEVAVSNAPRYRGDGIWIRA